jgi:hypothetical protein
LCSQQTELGSSLNDPFQPINNDHVRVRPWIATAAEEEPWQIAAQAVLPSSV